MRVRTLKSMNNINMMLTIHLGYIEMLVDKIDKKLLVIKIIEKSKSLRNKIIVYDIFSLMMKYFYKFNEKFRHFYGIKKVC